MTQVADGYYAVLVNNKWAIVGEKGSIVIPAKLDWVSAAETESGQIGTILIEAEQKAWRFDPTTQKLVETEPVATYDAEGQLIDGLRPVKQGEQWGLVDAAGQTIVKPRYASLEIFGEAVRFEADGKFGLLGRQGSVVVPAEYDEIVPTGEAFWKMRKADKWGLLDAHGKELLPLQFTELLAPENDVVQARVGGKWGLYDYHNKIVAEPKWERMDPFFGNSLARVWGGDDFGYLNRAGKLVYMQESEPLPSYTFTYAPIKPDAFRWEQADQVAQSGAYRYVGACRHS